MLRTRALFDPALRDRITPDNLNVAPALLGVPLARPGRRLVAITIDMIVVALLSNVGNLWLLAGLALPLWMQLHEREVALSTARRALGWGVAVALLAFGAYEARRGDEPSPSSHRPRLSVSGAQGLASAPAGASGATTGGFTLDGKPSAAASDAASNADGAVREVADAPVATADAERIAALEAEVAALRERKSFDPLRTVREWADDVGLGLGWAIVYFSMLPVWWNGQTVGKRLLRLRVVELTGKPHTAMLAFKRYGGYAAGVATGLFGFAQILWDPNRQAIQDKTAHTVVIDLRPRLPATHMNHEETR